MTRAVWLKVLIVFAVSVALASTPKSSFAQRGGGGFHGGGSFHGGGFGGSGFHSGGFGGGGFHGGGFGRGFGGFHNGGLNGFHGGWGFPGGWGWGGWGWGWGLNIGFGWPYWGWGYPYYYDYGPYAYGYPYPYAPYYYPDYSSPPDRRYDYRSAPENRAPENREPDYRHDNSKPNDQTAPAKPSNTLVPGNSAGENYVTRNHAPNGTISGSRTAPKVSANNFQLASSKSRVPFGPSPLRPQVQNAIRLLQAIPPQARQERLNSSRYADFSPAERLRTATQSPQLN
jgi:hypothetical protein